MKNLLIGLFLCLVSTSVFAQGRAFYLGLQPSVRMLDNYLQGQYDLNMVPLVGQLTLNKEMDLRVTSIVDYHFSEAENGISNIGGEIALPVAVNAKVARGVESEGLFVAPVYMYFQNKPTNTNYHTFAIEPGYMQVFGHRFGISAGLQLGGRYHKTQQQEGQWTSHIALKLVFGYWFRRDVVLGV